MPGETLGAAALDKLDEAARSPGFDAELLSVMPARDIRAQIETAIGLLERLDYRRLLRKQGPISRLTGADIEARLEFELAGQQVLLVMGQLRTAAENGRHIAALLKKSRADLVREQARLEDVAAAAGELLSADGPGDDLFIRSRFERRLSNILAICAANILTAEQMRLAEDVLAGLLDRFTDVETVLLPLWRHNMLALAHAAGGRAQRQAVSEFAAIHTNLIRHLAQDRSA